MSGIDYQRGDLVWVRRPHEWVRGIATDVFTAPVSERLVVVVGGEGYYADTDVVPDEQVADVAPESLKV